MNQSQCSIAMPQSSQLTHRGPISLPLLKFSSATDPADATKFSWTHTFEDLLIVFDNYGSDRYGQQPSSIMKILQGAKLLDHVDLIEKIRECEVAMNHARQIQIQLKADQLPTSALYRRMSSTIAIRYTLPDNKVDNFIYFLCVFTNEVGTQIRRVQLKFTSVQDFDTALAILEDVRCPLHNSAPPGEAGSIAPTRPATASSTLTRITAQNSIVAAIQRPSSASSRPFHIPHNASDDIYDAEIPGGPQRPYPVSSEYFPPSQHINRSYTSSLVPLTQNAHSYRPSTPLTSINENEASIYSDPVLQNIGAFDIKSRRIDPLRPRSSLAFDNDHRVSSIQSDPALPNTATDSRLALTGSSRFFSTDVQSHHRPSTAPLSGPSQIEGDITSMIPPRRELPFKRPGSSRDGSSSSLLSTTSDLRPLPTPSFARASSSNYVENFNSMTSPVSTACEAAAPNQVSDDKLAPKRARKRKASVANDTPRKAPTAAKLSSSKAPSRLKAASGTAPLNDSSSNFQTSSPPRAKTALNENPVTSHNISPFRIAHGENQTTDGASSNSRVQPYKIVDMPMPSSSHQVQSSLPKEVNTSCHIDPSQPRDTLTLASLHSHAESMALDQTFKGSLERIERSFSASPAVIAADTADLASYSTMNCSDRMSVVEKNIIALVSDDNFATLCEDVYGCWQRIGFGV